MHSDIFSALSKYSWAEAENYLTEAFAFLLRTLLVRNRTLALDLLSILCEKKEGPPFFSREDDIVVFTQAATEHGRPDMKITAPDKFVYVEVKDYSGIGPGQLEKYRVELNGNPARHRRLVLLTRYAVDPSETRGLADNQIRWYQIHDLLRRSEPADEVSKYLILAFTEFLKEKKMAVEKVGREYINGVPALSNLMTMIETAIARASLRKKQESRLVMGRGLYLEGGKYWCGVYYDSHMSIVFEIQHGKVKLDKRPLSDAPYPLKDEGGWLRYRLNLESDFFSLTVDEQLHRVTKFLRECSSDAKNRETH